MRHLRLIYLSTWTGFLLSSGWDERRNRGSAKVLKSPVDDVLRNQIFPHYFAFRPSSSAAMSYLASASWACKLAIMPSLTPACWTRISS